MNISKMKNFEITEDRVEQWETEYSIKELGIRGTELEGLIQKLANEVYILRNGIDQYIDFLCGSNDYAIIRCKKYSKEDLRKVFFVS